MALSTKNEKSSTTSAHRSAENQRREREILQQQFRNYHNAGLPLVITNATVKGQNAVFVIMQDAYFCAECGNISAGAACGKGCGKAVVTEPVTVSEPASA